VDVVNQDWRDQNAAGWAKAARVRHHIEDVSHQVSAYNPASAYEIVPEPRPDTGDDSHATDLRLKVLRKPSTELLTTIGDALHNLRSCLDSVAFELAMRHTGGTMTEKQQRAVHGLRLADLASLRPPASAGPWPNFVTTTGAQATGQRATSGLTVISLVTRQEIIPLTCEKTLHRTRTSCHGARVRPRARK
jgi:hypothetical protein